MTPPLVSYITFNRMGLLARNLKSVLDTPEDFEIHIIDSNSKDDTWEYLESVSDPRIKSKTRLPVNSGPIYGLNFNLVKRRPDQYFITLDNDVFIKTGDWITRMIKVFEAFPRLGALGSARPKPYYNVYPPVIPKVQGDISYLELRNGKPGEILDFAHGCLMCLRPELIEKIGYWSEENGYGDAELCARINNYTPFRVGFLTNADYSPIVDIEMEQTIPCEDCIAKEYCKLDKVDKTCFTIRNKRYMNEPFVGKFRWKYLETFKELEEGKRTAYCASILDPASVRNHLFHQEWALENFSYYIENSN